jgi:uncharacterized membrane protein
MELTLNLIWLGVALAGFALVPKRRSRMVWFALIGVAVLLFPIISISDDFKTDWAFNDAAAAVVAMIVLSVVFVAIGRLRSYPRTVVAVHVDTPSDPRSPPAR